MQHSHKDEEHNVNHSPWFKRHRWITYCALAILAYFLIIEHRQHVLPFLPYLFLLACPFMHLFMHRGHGHHGHPSKDEEMKV